MSMSWFLSHGAQMSKMCVEGHNERRLVVVLDPKLLACIYNDGRDLRVVVL